MFLDHSIVFAFISAAICVNMPSANATLNSCGNTDYYNILVDVLQIPTNSIGGIRYNSFFGDKEVRICNNFHVKKAFIEHKNFTIRNVFIYDNNNSNVAHGGVYEESSYLHACMCAADYCFGQTSMVARHYALGLRLRKDIGDFCIHRRESGDDPDRLCFVRGHMMVHLRKGQAYNGSLVEIAKAIDEAILADAKECQQTHGKDANQ